MTNNPQHDEKRAAPAARPKLVPWIVLVVMMGLGIALAVVKIGGSGGARSLTGNDGNRTGKTVTLVIDFGDRRREFGPLAWRSRMTVEDLMDRVTQLPDGVPYKNKGQGEGTFLLSLGGVENQGGGKKAKNWIFYVNGKMGQTGYGTTLLKPGDTVLWKFAAYEYNGS